MRYIRRCGRHLVFDRGVWKEFETSRDAWAFILLLKDVRENVVSYPMWRSPVRSLVPGVMKKTVRINIER